MPRQFVDLPGAATLEIIDDLVTAGATGVVHGPAGTGKTFAVEAALERLRDPTPPDPAPTELADPAVAGPRRATEVVTCTLAFPSRPTMRLVADGWCGR